MMQGGMYVCRYIGQYIMYEGMQASMRLHTYTYMSLCIHGRIYLWIYMNSCIYACLYVLMYACMDICIHMYVYACIVMCTHSYAHMQVCARVYPVRVYNICDV